MNIEQIVKKILFELAITGAIDIWDEELAEDLLKKRINLTPKHLEWSGENLKRGMSAITCFGNIRIEESKPNHFRVYENHPNPKFKGGEYYGDQEIAKEYVQNLHNKRLLEFYS